MNKNKEYMRDMKLDLLFKYVFGMEEADSLYLLRTLVEGVIHDGIGDIIHKNVESIRRRPNEKGVRFDILFADEYENKYDAEMQNSGLNESLVKRFGYYGSLLVVNNVNMGEEYNKLKKSIQVILIDHKLDHLVNLYLPKDLENRTEGYQFDMNEKNSLHMRYYVSLPYINEVAKEKELKDFSDFELIIYMIENGIDERVKKLNRKVVEIMARRVEEFNNDQILSMQAFERQVYLITHNMEIAEGMEKGIKEGMERGKKEGLVEGMERGKKEGLVEGMEKGIKEGIKEGIKKGLIKGKFELLLLQLREKYPGIDCKWVEELDESRLIYASQLIMKPISYEEFYDLVMNFAH